MLYDVLWRSNLDLVRSCLAHPFVQGLGDGTLKADLFRDYIAQDAFFLRAFANVYGLALARSSAPEIIAWFSELIGGVQEELKLHRVYAAELGIDLERVAPNPACRAYTDFVLRTAWHGSLAETVAAIAPCMSLYAFLGRELLPRCGPQHPYRKWIETYSSGGFAQLANRLESLLDQVGADTREVRGAYRYALECELAFFSVVGVPPLTEKEIVFYDGHCGLCHRGVKFVLKHDRSGTAFRFAPLQGEKFQTRVPVDQRANLPNSIVVQTRDGSLIMRSNAWIHILRRLGGGWKVMAALIAVIPRPPRDVVYEFVARIRYRVFGRRDDLRPVVPPELRARFDP